MKGSHHFRLWKTVSAVLLLSLCCSTTGETFVHPGGAYKFDPPAGYQRHAFVHGRGIPLHVFSPDKGQEADDFKRGIWVYAFPVPTDIELEASELTMLIRQLLTGNEPDLRVDLKAKETTTLGALKAVALPCDGRRDKTGNWKGRVLVATQEDSYLVVSYGGPPKEFDDISKTCEAALKTFVAPVKLISIDAPPKPAKPKTPAEVEELLRPVTPMVRRMCRTDRKDEGSKLDERGSGSGFIIHSDGYVVTNRHVVETVFDGEGGRIAFDPVRLTWDERVKQDPVDADVVAISCQFDLALLKIRGQGKKWPVVPMADIDDAKAAQSVTAGGWPVPQKYGDTRLSTTHGKITGMLKDPRGRRGMTHTAWMDHGNSGGPLYNHELSAVIGTNYLGSSGPNAIYVAVPIHRVLWEFPQIATTQPAAKLSLAEHRALVAYYSLQKRYGAAMIEAHRALKTEEGDGVVSAYLYGIYKAFDDPGRAESYGNTALNDPDARKQAMLIAIDIQLDNLQTTEATIWAHKLWGENRYDKDAMAALCRAMGDATFVQQAPFREYFENDAEMEMLAGRSLVRSWLRNVQQLPAQYPLPDASAQTASAALEKAMKLWPGYRGICHAYLAILAQEAGRKTKAQEHHDKAIEAAPGNLEVRLTLAHFDLLRGDRDGAIANITTANRYLKRTAVGIALEGWWRAAEADRLEAAGKLQEAQSQREMAFALLTEADHRRAEFNWNIEVLKYRAHVQQAYAKAKQRGGK